MRSRLGRSGVAATTLVVGLVAVACSGGAAAPIERVQWTRTPPLSGTVVSSVVQLVAPETGGSLPLVELEHPVVKAPGYAIRGNIRYQDVTGTGFIEMWSVFPNGSRYFSRTEAATGLQARMSGDSGWRAFEVPFFLDPGPAPSRLELNVVLPGSGRVWFGPIELVELNDTNAGGASRGWWSQRTGGLIGAVGGSAVGFLGALLGVLVARRRARRRVLGAMIALAIVGAGCLGVGIAAIIAAQPYAVYFPLLLGGAILVGVFVPSYRSAKRAFEDAELRKMRAMDLSLR